METADHQPPDLRGAPASNPGPPPEAGLRARKKEATRHALTEAAMGLVAEHGFDEVTVERICRVVDVSPRTFFNYFASKEEALVGPGPVAPDDELLATFEAGGPDGRLLADLGTVLTAHFDRHVVPHDQMVRRHALLRHEPALQMHFRASLRAVEDRLALAVGRRTGRDPDDHEVRLLVAIVAAAIRSALARWARGGGDGAPADHVARVFANLDRAVDTDALLDPDTAEP